MKWNQSGYCKGLNRKIDKNQDYSVSKTIHKVKLYLYCFFFYNLFFLMIFIIFWSRRYVFLVISEINSQNVFNFIINLLHKAKSAKRLLKNNEVEWKRNDQISKHAYSFYVFCHLIHFLNLTLFLRNHLTKIH